LFVFIKKAKEEGGRGQGGGGGGGAVAPKGGKIGITLSFEEIISEIMGRLNQRELP